MLSFLLNVLWFVLGGLLMGLGSRGELASLGALLPTFGSEGCLYP